MKVRYETMEDLYEKIVLTKGDLRIQFLFFHSSQDGLPYRSLKALHLRRLRKELNALNQILKN